MVDDAHPTITTTREGGGLVLTCECAWTRYETTPPGADAAAREHAKKCRGPKVKPEQIARPASRVKWDDREGATWIDSM